MVICTREVHQLQASAVSLQGGGKGRDRIEFDNNGAVATTSSEDSYVTMPGDSGCWRLGILTVMMPCAPNTVTVM